MSDMKKITLEDLIKRKEQIEANKKKRTTLYIESLNGTITIEKPSLDVLAKAQGMDPVEGDKYLVYSCVVEPNIKDKQLQSIYGCIEPYDIVEKIFDELEIPKIAKACMDLAGFKNRVEVVDAVKN
jgi:hypothetical protein